MDKRSKSGIADMVRAQREFRNTFQYFYEVSGPSLVNFGSHYFWNKLVLQAGHDDESIRNLITVASALDRQRRETSSKCLISRGAEYAHHYRRALQMLSSVRSPDVGNMLIACLLLILIEELQQNRFAALQHLFAGRKIVSSYNDAQPPRYQSDSFEEINELFSRLELQTSELNQESQPYHVRWPFYEKDPEPPPVPDLPRPELPKSAFQTYDTIQMAGVCLQNLVPACLAPITSSLPPASRFHIVPQVTAQLNQWLTYFNNMAARLSPRQAAAQRVEIHLLWAYHVCMGIMSRCAPYNDELLYDRYAGDFEHACVKLSHLITIGGMGTDQLHERLLCPLYFVASKYRDVSYRHRTMRNLRSCGWSGARLASILEQVIEMEEGNDPNVVTCDSVPNERRISLVDIGFERSERTEKMKCLLYYHRSRESFVENPRIHRFWWQDVGDEAVQRSIRSLLLRMLRFDFLSAG